MEFYTYIYYDPSRNNEPIYVGKGKGARAWKHLYKNNMHPFTQRLQLMKRNKVNPIIGFYSEFDEEFAHFVEEELITKFGRKDLGLGPLLNLTDGGEGSSGHRHTDSTRKQMSTHLLGLPKSEKHKRNISVASIGKPPTNKGVPHSTETKQKIGLANSGSNNGMYGIAPPNKGICKPKQGKIILPRKKRDTVTCPSCNKSGDISNMKRWHFEFCRML